MWIQSTRRPDASRNAFASFTVSASVFGWKRGQPWLQEAVGTGLWRGTPLRALLREAGLEDGAVEVGSGLGGLTKVVPCHGQEEQVEGVELTLAGGEALFQGRDCLGKQARDGKQAWIAHTHAMEMVRQSPLLSSEPPSDGGCPPACRSTRPG